MLPGKSWNLQFPGIESHRNGHESWKSHGIKTVMEKWYKFQIIFGSFIKWHHLQNE